MVMSPWSCLHGHVSMVMSPWSCLHGDVNKSVRSKCGPYNCQMSELFHNCLSTSSHQAKPELL